MGCSSNKLKARCFDCSFGDALESNCFDGWVIDRSFEIENQTPTEIFYCVDWF